MRTVVSVFFIIYSSVVVDDNYVVHLKVKHIQMSDYMECTLTISISSDLDTVLHIKLDNIYWEYMNLNGQLLNANVTVTNTGILKVGSHRGLKPMVVNKHVTFHLPPLLEENKTRYYSPHVQRRLKQQLNLKDP